MPTFEEQMKELEAVVNRLERGTPTLEENIELFERGMRLTEACKQHLAQAESRIQALVHPEAPGPVRVEDLALEVEDEQGGENGGRDGLDEFHPLER